MRLRVAVDIVSSQALPREVACVEIFNTNEGDGTHEHYAVEGHTGDRQLRRASIGLVKRNATAPLSLAARGLYALGYVVPETPRDTDVGRCEAKFRDYVARELSLSDADIETASNEVFGKAKRGKP